MTKSIRDCLVNTLDDLDKDDLEKRFIHNLCEHKFGNFGLMRRGHFKNVHVSDIVDKIIRHYGEGNAGKLTVEVLEAINQRNASNELSMALEKIRTGETVPAEEVDAPVWTGETVPTEEVDALGLWTLTAMERHATENMDNLYKSLRAKIGEEGMKTIEDGVRGKRMKASFSITAKEAHDIVSNKKFKGYRSQAKGDIKLFPWNLAANYLLDGMAPRGQRARERHGSEADVGGSPVDVTNESEEEPPGTIVDSLRKPAGVDLIGGLQISGPTEAAESLDVAEDKGVDNDIKLPSQDSGIEPSQIKDEGEEVEEGNDRGESLSQSPPQVISSSTSGTACRSANSVKTRIPPMGARATAKQPRRKDVWTAEEEIKAKRDAKQQWLKMQVDEILTVDNSRSREQVAEELEASLQQVHNQEHPVYSALRARSCLVYTVRKGDHTDKVVLLLQLPTKPGGSTFPSCLKNGDLNKMKLSCIQYNMGVLGGISRTDVAFYSKDTEVIRYNEDEFNSNRKTLEEFIEEAVRPVLAVYLRVQREQGVFLEAQG